jgi:hypothetical protein
MEHFSISYVLNKSLYIIKKNLYPLLILAIIFSAAVTLALVVPLFFKGVLSNRISYAIFSIALGLFCAIVFMSACSFTLDLCARGKADFKKLIPQPIHTLRLLISGFLLAVFSIPFYMIFALLGIMVSFLSYKGFLLLSIALSIFYYYFICFRMAFAVLFYAEGRGAFEGLAGSYDLTSENGWPLLFLFILCAGLNFAGSLFFFIGVSLTAPITLVIYSCAYLHCSPPVFEDEPQIRDEVREAEPLYKKQEEKPKPAHVSIEENEESYLGKGKDIDYSGLNEKIFDRSSFKNKEKQ